MAGPTAVHTQNYQTVPSRPSQDSSGMYRPQPSGQPTQSVISMDETVPYARGVDRSEVLNSKGFLSLIIFSNVLSFIIILLVAVNFSNTYYL